MIAKTLLKLQNLHMLIKQKSPSLTKNLALWTFGELHIVFSTKGNLLYLLYFNGPAKFFVENFSKNSSIDDSGISLSVFPSRTNMKLHNISVTPKMVIKIITVFGLSKVSGPDCIPVVVLKKCEPGKRSTDKNYHPVSLLSVVSKIVEKLVNNMIICTLFYGFWYKCFISFRSTADLLTAVSDRIARAFSRYGATWAAVLDISKAFDKVWYAGPLNKLKYYGISVQIFGLTSFFLVIGSFRWF